MSKRSSSFGQNVTLKSGDKVRQDGKTYKVVDTSVISGELIEVKAQTNHHKAFECSDGDCRLYQIGRNGKVWTGRTGSHAISDRDGLPKCQYCDNPLSWRVTSTKPTSNQE